MIDAEINLGESLELPCPCSEYLTSLPDASRQNGVRKCGGSFRNGAQLLDTDFSQCATSVNETSRTLCWAITVCKSALVIANTYSLCVVLMPHEFTDCCSRSPEGDGESIQHHCR